MIRLLLSEVAGESNSLWQAEVVRKLVCSLLDKCLVIRYKQKALPPHGK